MKIITTVLVLFSATMVLGEPSSNMTYACAFDKGYGRYYYRKLITGESQQNAKINFLNSYDIKKDGFYIKNQQFFAPNRKDPILRVEEYKGVICNLTEEVIIEL